MSGIAKRGDTMSRLEDTYEVILSRNDDTFDTEGQAPSAVGLALWCKSMRTYLGWSLSELSRRSGINPNRVGAIERAEVVQKHNNYMRQYTRLREIFTEGCVEKKKARMRKASSTFRTIF